MSRMTEDQRAAFAAETASHNAAVVADIEEAAASFEALKNELAVASPEDAKLRDALDETYRVFKHQFTTLVRPLIAQRDAGDGAS